MILLTLLIVLSTLLFNKHKKVFLNKFWYSALILDDITDQNIQFDETISEKSNALFNCVLSKFQKTECKRILSAIE